MNGPSALQLLRFLSAMESSFIVNQNSFAGSLSLSAVDVDVEESALINNISFSFFSLNVQSIWLAQPS